MRASRLAHAQHLLGFLHFGNLFYSELAYFNPLSDLLGNLFYSELAYFNPSLTSKATSFIASD